jgi:ribosomal protein L40E
MTERRGRGRGAALSREEEAARAEVADDSERTLGRAVAIGLPLVGIGSAVVVGVVASFGTALLVLAASALIGTIGLLWASVRTLSGDAPLPAGFEAIARQRHSVDPLGERKRRVLRSLKDLEAEHALGKIDDADYGVFVTRYRAEAKDVMREMDEEVAPSRDEAERVAREYLKRHGISQARAPEAEPPRVAAGAPSRRICRACQASNEPDAVFCKACGASIEKAAERADATP